MNIPMHIDGIWIRDYWKPMVDIQEHIAMSIIHDLNYYITEFVEQGGNMLSNNRNIMGHFNFLQRIGKAILIPIIETISAEYSAITKYGHAVFSSD